MVAVIGAGVAAVATWGALNAQVQSARAQTPNKKTIFTMVQSGAANKAGCTSPTPPRTRRRHLGPHFHLGLWFNSPEDAAAAGCPNTVTPFNGDHTAGIQALSTRNLADDQGPLRQIVP